MKRAALGFRMHSGWGVLIAVSGDGHSVEILDRRRIVVTDSGMPGATQPYHYGASLEIAEAERHIANCAALSERLALAAVGEVVRGLEQRKYRTEKAAVLLASGRALPPLAKILAAHPLIHTAEGEFFRNVVRQACERLKIAILAIPERELEERAKAVLGKEAGLLQRRITTLGRSVGPPWTKDHKAAALAALVVLADK
ncbi:MAG: hypothetical protein WA830_03045 [Candidatus Sulfotelmatobacter sp.]